jgi:hypothetical protein
MGLSSVPSNLSLAERLTGDAFKLAIAILILWLLWSIGRIVYGWSRLISASAIKRKLEAAEAVALADQHLQLQQREIATLLDMSDEEFRQATAETLKRVRYLHLVLQAWKEYWVANRFKDSGPRLRFPEFVNLFEEKRPG